MNDLGEILRNMLPQLHVDKQNFLQYFEQHPELQEMIEKNHWSKEQILPALNQLYQYIDEKHNCQHCTGIDHCENMLNGHYIKLDTNHGQIQSTLTKCRYLLRHEEDTYKNQLFQNQYVAHDILNSSFQNMDHSSDRQETILSLLEFTNNIQDGKNTKGIYLYGPLGVGKSHLMAATAKEIADNGISTLMVYVPDFFREMKQSIQDQSLHEKMELLKEVQVLILDDIGAETISQWERDEILGAILQARMVKGLPTLYTSNLDYDGLEEHLAYSNKGGIEELKAKRILERIRHYTVPIFLDGPNRRKG
ncbi:primosomal protein DnaI [Tepidibacillus marianensis]|uniref:primosomal protein DnaI n=1 Tax=Tepidibacillus marianensis TaxID=3131995 RepID=UPI0030D50C6F